jgi:hypothetical protein
MLRSLPLIPLALLAACASSQKLDRFDRYLEHVRSTSPEQRADRLTLVLRKALELTDPQATEIRAVSLQYARRIQEIAESDASRKSKARRISGLIKQQDRAIDAALTPEQRKVYQSKKEGLRRRAEEGRR